jgi:hypothetical protein
LDRRDKAIAPAGQCLDKSGVLCIVPESQANFRDSRVECVIEIDERVIRPDLGSKLFPCNQFARMSNEESQDLEWLYLQGKLYALLAQFRSLEVGFERPKSDRAGIVPIFHDAAPRVGV